MPRMTNRRTSQRRDVDILHVAGGATPGWRVIDETLRHALLELDVSLARVAITRPWGGLLHRARSPANDLYQAACLTAVARRGLQQFRPRAIIYSTSHAALLQPRRVVPEALWVDGPIALTRPGRLNAPLRTLERSRQGRLDLVLPMSLQHPDEIAAPLRPRAVVPLHMPVHRAGGDGQLPPGLTRPFGVIYAGAPGKKGLDIAIEAWRLAGIQHPLVVTGIERREARKYVGNDPPKEIVFGGVVPRATHREIIRQSAVYVSASRREEYGTTQLEALADGVPLVAVPSRGLSEAVAIARRLRPDLVAKAISPLSLAERVRTVFQLTTAELARYRADAASLMEQYSYQSFKQRLADDVLPILLR